VTIDIEETGSGAARDRPGLGQIMAAAHRAEIEAVIIWKLDRLGRSTVDLLRNVETLKTCGVRFIVTTQGIDTFGDALGSFVLTILAGVAEYERTVFRERVDLGLRKARAAGKVFGRPKKTDVRAELVAELRASGLSWSACALTLGCTVALARRRAGEAARAAK
jgi:DNA invertase Pin-like site-specific DNA recombinase